MLKCHLDIIIQIVVPQITMTNVPLEIDSIHSPAHSNLCMISGPYFGTMRPFLELLYHNFWFAYSRHFVEGNCNHSLLDMLVVMVRQSGGRV